MAEKKSVLTLNLGSQRVGMARFGIGGKGSLMLKEYQFAEMPGDPTTDGTRRFALNDAIKQLSGALRVQDGEVNYAVPGQFLIAKFVKLPSLAEDQVDKIVGFEAQQAVPFPLNETVWDYQLMGKTGGEMEVGIVAIRAEHLGDLNSAVEDAGLAVRTVDAAPVALYNAFRYNYPESDGCALLIDLGARTTNLIFIEGRRAFISSFQTGGASLTQAIVKEIPTMGDFDSVEQRKVAEGFVNLGGNYEDHEDPEIDNMSKVLRNALARIHGEIVRRTNAYRQQQGGSAPSVAYLAGAGASLPYVKEVIEEKLRVPVEYFNALKNVGVGPKVDVERISSEAHTLGELVGLALREMACPMELDLSPKSVQARRDVGNRKPFLYAAAAAWAAMLLGVWVYNSRAAAGYARETQKLETSMAPLADADADIKKAEDKEKKYAARADVLSKAVLGQKYWVKMFDTLNKLFKDDQIWIVQVTPYNEDGNDVPGKLYENAAQWPFDTTEGSKLPKEKMLVTDLLVVGINRNPEGTNAIEFFEKLVANTEYFAFPPKPEKTSEAKWREQLLSKYLRNDVGDLQLRDGYAFTMRLPLKRRVDVNLKSTKPK